MDCVSKEPISEFKICSKRIIHPYAFAGLKAEVSCTSPIIKTRQPKPTDSLPRFKTDASRIAQSVCDAFGVNMDDLCTKTRKKNIVEPRQAYYYLMRRFSNYSLKEISKTLPSLNQDHTTIMYASDTIEAMIETKDELGYKVLDIIDKLKSATQLVEHEK